MPLCTVFLNFCPLLWRIIIDPFVNFWKTTVVYGAIGSSYATALYMPFFFFFFLLVKKQETDLTKKSNVHFCLCWMHEALWRGSFLTNYPQCKSVQGVSSLITNKYWTLSSFLTNYPQFKQSSFFINYQQVVSTQTIYKCNFQLNTQL